MMNNKKTYYEPEIEIVKLSLSDVILTSTEDAMGDAEGVAPEDGDY